MTATRTDIQEQMRRMNDSDRINGIDTQKILDLIKIINIKSSSKKSIENILIEAKTESHSTTQFSLPGFNFLNQTLGATKTGYLYENQDSKQEYVVKNTKVRQTEGRMVLSCDQALISYLDYQLFYLSKQLTPKEIAYEKLGYDLYELCGVNVPRSRILTSGFSKKSFNSVEKYCFCTGYRSYECIDTGNKVAEVGSSIYQILPDEKEAEILHIASEKISGFKTLNELMGVENSLNHPELNKKRFAELGSKQTINGKPVKGFFESLPVMAFLFDWDGLGAALNNFGFIDRGDYFEFVKIDPGEVCLLNSPDGKPIDSDGFVDLKQAGSTILRQFQEYKDDCWNFQKAFASATYEQKLIGLRAVTSLTDLQINHVVRSSQGARFIPEEEQNNIIKELIRRRDVFKMQYKNDLLPDTKLDSDHDSPSRDRQGVCDALSMKQALSS